MSEQVLDKYEPQVDELFERCQANAPNVVVPAQRFKMSVNKSLARFAGASAEPVTEDEVT